MIKQSTIEHLLDLIAIEDLIGGYVKLKKSGANYIGLCPFHNEKTPSFVVSPSKGIFKCFGCGKGGNAIIFLKEYEHYSYIEAIKFLAKKYNITIEEDELNSIKNNEKDKDIKKREELFIAYEFANNFYIKNFNESEEGISIAKSYMLERAFREDILEKFQIGYALSSKDALYLAAKNKNYDVEIFKNAGLLKEKEKSGIYDVFRERIIFPIHNLSGKVIAFGARTLKKDEKTPKYINSPESEIYKKSSVLYGLYFTKKYITKNDSCFLVEGYADLISMFQSGFENVVATSGTSLTVEQVRLIKRYTKNIIILYDSDIAGIKATLRAIDMFLEQGISPKIVVLPEGEDPDSYLKKLGSEKFKKFLLNNLFDFVEFKKFAIFNKIYANLSNLEKKSKAIKEIIRSIALIPFSEKVEEMLRIKQCSEIFNISEERLYFELNNQKRKIFKQEHIKVETIYDFKNPENNEITDFEDKNIYSKEKEIIRLLLNYANNEVKVKAINENNKEIEINIPIYEYIIRSIEEDEITFSNNVFKEIYNYFKECYNKNITPTSSFFIHNDNEEISKIAIELTTSQYKLDKWHLKQIIVKKEEEILFDTVNEAIRSIKREKIKDKCKELSIKIKECNNKEELNKLIKEKMQWDKIQQMLSSKDGIVIYK